MNNNNFGNNTNGQFVHQFVQTQYIQNFNQSQVAQGEYNQMNQQIQNQNLIQQQNSQMNPNYQMHQQSQMIDQQTLLRFQQQQQIATNQQRFGVQNAYKQKMEGQGESMQDQNIPIQEMTERAVDSGETNNPDLQK